MKDLTLNRREFLKGCCATAAVGAVGPAMLFSDPAYAAVNPYDTVVHVFLRGGIDGLNLVPPISGDDRIQYEQARPNLQIAATGTYGALPLTLAGGGATGFGLHPSATGLRDLWNDGRLAIVHGCGLLTSVTRSHFDAQLYLDLGTPGQKGSGSGWITRAWATQPGATGLETMPALAVNSRTPANMLGATQALSMGSPADFALNAGSWAWQMRRTDSPAGFEGVNETLAQIWNGRSRIEKDGLRADHSLRVIAQQPYAGLPATWPDNNFSRQLWTVAQSIRFNLGMRYATVDLGGWDTHDGQGTAGAGYNYYQNKIAELSQALAALYAELSTGGEIGRVTIVVQSEFGRRVQAERQRRYRSRLRQSAAGAGRRGQRPSLLRQLAGARPGRARALFRRRTGDHRLSARVLRTADPAHGQQQARHGLPWLQRLFAARHRAGRRYRTAVRRRRCRGAVGAVAGSRTTALRRIAGKRRAGGTGCHAGVAEARQGRSQADPPRALTESGLSESR